ncbi:MAG: DUF1592 domain-containing protein [Polyangiaceae bacterium]|nr:DUF1592 domain-containing protein [Polyangiaceae bacterium]
MRWCLSFPRPIASTFGCALRATGVLALTAAALAGCTGEIGDGGPPGGEIPTPEEAAEVGVSGARRLTAIEYRNTVFDLVGIDVADAELILPTDERTPFDNDFTTQISSQALIDGSDLLAGEIAAEVLASPELREKVVSCEPSGPDDEACYRTFVEEFGRRALRRSLSSEEVDAFVTHFMPHASQASDFWVAVDSGLRAFLQHPEFLFRIEIGTPVPGLAGMFRLNNFEIATRLSYFLWGSTPPDWLLDRAEAGELTEPAGIREAAEKMLEDERALSRLARFHAMWLSYEQIPAGGTLAESMTTETNALLGRYILDESRPWSDLLTAKETFLTPELATHYGLPAPSNPEGDWVPYGDSGRAGILSHGTFLGAVAKFVDTSPTQRGLLIRTRLFCMTIDRPPPELMVNTDEPPQAADPDACKIEKYSMWQQDGCKQCHAFMDPVGFGLENFDALGRFREAEVDKPECTIDGVGNLEGVGSFDGPAELGALMVDSGEVDACVARQLYRYAVGRSELEEPDHALIERIVGEIHDGGEALRLDVFIGDYVASEAFQLRREEEVTGE